MTMTGFIRAGFAFLVSIVSVYILEITYGAAMDQLYIHFYNLLPLLPMSPGWKDQALATLGGWVWFYRAFLIVIIAVGVWMVSTIIVEIDYAKRLG